MGNGTEMKRWTLPKELLTHHSLFFAGALNDSFAEANSKCMNLPDDDPRAFSSFIRWLYTGIVEPDPDAISLAQAWVLGKKLECSAFSDKALLEMIDYHHPFLVQIKPSSIQFAYKNSRNGSKLRMWALDEFLYSIKLGWDIEFEDTEIKDLMELDDWGIDLMKALTRVGSARAESPMKNPELYMEVLDHRTARSLQRRTSFTSSLRSPARSSRHSTPLLSRSSSWARSLLRSTFPTSRSRSRTRSLQRSNSPRSSRGRLLNNCISSYNRIRGWSHQALNAAEFSNQRGEALPRDED